jgi:hypothetical protein
VKTKEVKNGCNLEDYASKRAVLPVEMMMMMMMVNRMITECEAAGGITNDRRHRITRRKPVSVPLTHYDEGKY